MKLKSLVIVALLILGVAGCDITVGTPTTPSPTVSNVPVANSDVVINLFGAEPGTTIISGQTVTLRWAASGPIGTTCRIDPNVGDVPLAGFVQFSLVNSATFTLTCSNGQRTASRVLPVVVIK